MQVSHRTWRGLVTAPPQSRKVHKGSALALIGFCSVVDDVAAAWGDALRALTSAYAWRWRREVSGVAAEYVPSIALPKT